MSKVNNSMVNVLSSWYFVYIEINHYGFELAYEAKIVNLNGIQIKVFMLLTVVLEKEQII